MKTDDARHAVPHHFADLNKMVESDSAWALQSQNVTARSVFDAAAELDMYPITIAEPA